MPDLDPTHNNAAGWNAHYLAGDWPWDRGEPHPELLRWLGERPAGWPDGRLRVVVPGCGLGNDVRGWAAAGHAVTGLDLSDKAVGLARSLPKAGNESYLAGDLFAPPPDFIGAFDLVWEHTCYCALHPVQRPAYVEAVHRMLKPGGILTGVFLCHPDKPLDEGPPFSSRPDDVRYLMEARFECLGFEPVTAEFERREGAERSGVWRARG